MIKKAIDMYLLYRVTKRLATPFTKWDAYKVGLIDENGNFIVASKDRTARQRASLTMLDKSVLKVKKGLGHIPGGKHPLGAIAAVLYTLKEEDGGLGGSVPTTNIGSGNIADPQIKQLFSKKKKKQLKRTD